MTGRPWLPATLIGLVGSLLLVPGALLPTGWLAGPCLAAGAIALFGGWWQLRPTVGVAPQRMILAVWSLPLLAIPPVASRDAYAYAAQGWLITAGHNPYFVPMAAAGPFAEGVDGPWQQATAVYPPLMLQLQALVVRITGSDPYWSVVGMRLLVVLAMVAIVALIPRIARDLDVDPQRSLWFIALNPLTVIHFIAGAHNDAIMVAGILLAIWLARRPGGLLWSMVALGLAACCKQAAVLIGPAVIWYSQHLSVDDHARRRQVIAGPVLGALVGGAVFALVSALTGLGWGWLRSSSGSPGDVVSHAPLSWVRAAFVEWGGVSSEAVDPWLTALSVITVVAVFIVMATRRAVTDPLRVGFGTLAAFLIAGTALQPWYLLWLVALFPWLYWRPRTWRWAGAVIAGVTVSGVVQAFWPPPVAVGIGILLAVGWLQVGRSGSTAHGAQ